MRARATAEARGWAGGQGVGDGGGRYLAQRGLPIGTRAGSAAYLSLSSLLTEESHSPYISISVMSCSGRATLQLACSLSQGRRVENDGGVRCSRFRAREGLLKLCTLGPSLWRTLELGAEMAKWRTKRFQRNCLSAAMRVLTKSSNSIQELKGIHIIGAGKGKETNRFVERVLHWTG